MMPVDSDKTTSHLLSMPVELRFKIHEEYYWAVIRDVDHSESHPVVDTARRLTKPLSVCRQFLQEVMPVLVKLNKTYLDDLLRGAEQREAELEIRISEWKVRTAQPGPQTQTVEVIFREHL